MKIVGITGLREMFARAPGRVKKPFGYLRLSAMKRTFSNQTVFIGEKKIIFVRNLSADPLPSLLCN